MIKYRILTAFVLIPLVLAALFFATPNAFALFTAIIVLLAAWEWSNFITNFLFLRILYVTFFVPLLWLSSYLPPHSFIFITIVFWTFAALPLILLYPKDSFLWRNATLRGFFGIMVLLPFWIGLNELFTSEKGHLLLLYVLVLIWIGDSAAYFIGKKFGKLPLALRISPGKTVEGFTAQVVASLLFATIISLFSFSMKGYLFIVFSGVTILFSVVGDLFESMMKRQRGIKDSGNFLPGHGGILDRIDSLTAAVPFFTAGYILMGL